MIHENPLIVPIQLTEESSASSKQIEKPVCHLKFHETEVTFYNGIDKHILHAVLAEMSKYAR